MGLVAKRLRVFVVLLLFLDMETAVINPQEEFESRMMSILNKISTIIHLLGDIIEEIRQLPYCQ